MTKVLILAGGFGIRLREETAERPKSMIEIGGHPLLWHIMNIFGAYSYEDFIVALGYKGENIKKYFLNHSNLQENLSEISKEIRVEIYDEYIGNRKLHLIDTGLNTGSGGRMKQLSPWISHETFMMAYGDGVSNVNIQELMAFHRNHGKLATMTIVHPPSQFGEVHLHGDLVTRFAEKPQMNDRWINAGFFVLEPEVMRYIEGTNIMWEQEPLQQLAAIGQLVAYRHYGFWQCMDTLRDVQILKQLWKEGSAPWKVRV